MNKSSLLFNTCVSVLASTITITAQAEGIYKWIDNQGQVNYADAVPAHIRAQKIDDRILVKPRRVETRTSSGNPDAGMTAGSKLDPNALPATSAGLSE